MLSATKLDFNLLKCGMSVLCPIRTVLYTFSFFPIKLIYEVLILTYHHGNNKKLLSYSSAN